MKLSENCSRSSTFSAGGLLLGSVAAIALSSVLTTNAAQADDLDDVVVTATKTPTKISDIPASVTVITAEDIEEQGVASVAELLRRTPGINFHSSGGIGKYTRVQIRGMDEQHTLVMIDGVRQNDPSDSSRSYDFEQLITHNIERIEIVRGPQATLYGSNASGGVINIITKKGSQDGFHGGAKAEYGSYATRRLDANISYGGKVENMPFSLSYAHSEYLANGPSVASEDHPVPAGKVQPNESDSTIIYNHSLRASLEPTEDLRGQVFFSVNDLSSDLDKTSSRVALDADYQKDKRKYNYGTVWDIDTFNDKLLHKIQLSGTTTESDYYRTNESSYAATNWHYLSYRAQTVQADYQGTYILNDHHKITFGGNWDSERFKRMNKDWSQAMDRKQYHGSTMLQLQSSFFEDAMHVNLGISYDMYNAFDNVVTYRGGISYEIPATQTLLKASAGTGYNAPSLFRLYRYDNPQDLKAEETTLFDLGFEQPLFDRRMTVAVTGFKNKVKNQIIYSSDASVCTGSTSYCYVNREEMNSKGVEAEVRALAYDGEDDSLELSTTYTYTLAQDENNQEIDRVPRHNLGLGAVYNFWNGDALVRADAQYMGRRVDYYDGSSNLIRDGGVWKLDLAAQYNFYKNWTAYARAENIFDADYTTSTGYTGTPQGFYVGLGYKF